MNAAGLSFLLTWVALSLGLSTTVALWAEPDVRTIIKKSVAANEIDFEAAPHYGYRERVRTGETTKTYDVMMIDGSPYNRLERAGKVEAGQITTGVGVEGGSRTEDREV